MRQLVNVLVSQFLAIHLLDAVGQQTAVQTDEIRLRQLTNQRRDVLVLHVCICVILRTCRRVHTLTVIRQELQLRQRLTVFRVLLAIQHERLRHLVVTLSHQRLFHLVLNILHLDVILNVQMAENLGDSPQVCRLVHTLERLHDRVHDLVQRETVLRPVSLRNGKITNFHCSSYIS